MYCTPSTSNEVGTPVMPELVLYCQSSLPVRGVERAEYAVVGAAAEHEAAAGGHDGAPVHRLGILCVQARLPRAQVPGLQLADVARRLGDT